MDINRGDVLVIDTRQGRVVGVYSSYDVAYDAVYERCQDEGWLVIAECTEEEAEVMDNVAEYMQEVVSSEGE